MKVIVEDLGILRHAEFDVGDLTIICGANNTGKTYATYALYGFLDFWNEAFNYSYINENVFHELMIRGSIKLELDDVSKTASKMINISCEEYSRNLSMVLGANEKYSAKSCFRISIDSINLVNINKEVQSKSPKGKRLCDISKKSGESFVTIKIIANAEELDGVSKEWFLHQINRDIQDVLFGSIFPAPFIASIERTGAATFQKELDITRNRLLEHVSNREKSILPFDLINTYYDGRYALPVRRDVDFIRDLDNVVKYKSEIVQKNPDILRTFDLLSGGEYKPTREGIIYMPDKSKKKLTMVESASSVRSLLNIGMYISHIARSGDYFMIDEPELNLHPINQRLMARLLAKLVNAGIRVFITTHSDYILKEFNTLIMLKSKGTAARRIMEKYGYSEDELLDVSDIKAYRARQERIHVEGRKSKKLCNVIIPAVVDEQGIEIDELDDTIIKMNEMQDEIIFSEAKYD